MAYSSELGEAERVRSKEKLFKESFVQEIEESISANDKVNRKHAHSMFVGPPGSGKSSLMDRLLGRSRKQLSLSTGVCDHIVVVDIDVVNPSTFHSVTVIDLNTWKEVDYDLSLVRQMDRVSIGASSSPEYVQSKLLEDIASPTMEMTSVPTQSAARQDSALPPSPEIVHHKHKPSSSAIFLSESRIKKMITAVVEKSGGFRKFHNVYTKSFSLYMRDTGGQVEFQEMVALLVFGPSIFLFVFRIDLDFQSKFSIEYRTSKSESTNCYTSSITTEEALLQCLASVYAMDTPGKVDVKTHKPLVLIIGTHKDRLGPSADEKIAQLNKHLDSLVTKSGFQDLVLYANSNKTQVMFAVDNTSESDEDFKAIRSKVHNVITSREEFIIEYPITYLLFCLELQNWKCSVLSLDEFKAIATKYGIMGDQVSHLLQFLYLRIGVIQYYDVDGLRHIVVKEPQVLFNKVTKLIIRTFSSEALTMKELQDFKKGILTASVLQNVVSSADKISCQDFLKLLVHLRIITPYPSTTPGDQEERYFIPCVLNRVQESSKEEQLHTDILPLSVRFQCSHCPKGLFGVLVTHLMTPESHDGHTVESHISFALIQDKIFKDHVFFEVRSYSDHDELSLTFLYSHIEIKFFPMHGEDRDMSVSEVCSNIRQVIKTSILRSLDGLHYNEHKVKPMMCFRCDQCSQLHEVSKGKDFHKIYCQKNRKNSRIPINGRCWYDEGEFSKK